MSAALSGNDSAKYLGVGRSVFYAKIAHKIPAVFPGGVKRWLVSDLDIYLSSVRASDPKMEAKIKSLASA